MHAFDIRITGEVDDESVAREIASDLIGDMLAGGSRVHHASMNGQEIRVLVDHVEVKASDPDAFVAKIFESALPSESAKSASEMGGG